MANFITLLRLFLVPVFLYFFLSDGKTSESIALVVFLLAAATDLIDGYIARLTGETTEFGRLVDPVADWSLIIAALFGLFYRGIIPLWSFTALVMRDAVLGGGILAMKAAKRKIVKVNFFGKVTNFVLMVSLCLLLFQTAFLDISGFIWLFFAGVVLYMASGLVYIVQQATLNGEGP